MEKRVYSLVLSDEVVAGIDQMAYEAGVSRSALINQILASAISYETPEARIQDAFAQLEALLTGRGRMQLVPQPSDAMRSFRGALRYKYNPTLRYSVALYKQPVQGVVGVLRLAVRSQSQDLLLAFEAFCRLWAGLEQTAGAGGASTLAPGRYERALCPTARLEPQSLGDAIAAYIGAMDRAVTTYFERLGQPDAAPAVEQVYRSFWGTAPPPV